MSGLMLFLFSVLVVGQLNSVSFIVTVRVWINLIILLSAFDPVNENVT